MADPTYINKDAEYLFALGGTFIEDGDLETGLRLRRIAANLQSLDEKAAQKGDLYIAGKFDAFGEFYGRSNIPAEDRAAPVPAQKMGFGSVKVQKVPMGATGLKKDEPAPKAKKTSIRAEGLGKLVGIKLNLNF